MFEESCCGKGMNGACPCGWPPRTTAPPVIVVAPCGVVMMVVGAGANGRCIDYAARGNGDGSDFPLGGFVKHKTLSAWRTFVFAGIVFSTSDAKDAAAGLGSGDKIIVGVKSEHTDVRFVAGVEEFALAVRRNGEDLAFVAGGDVQRAIGCEGQIPNVFCFGVEEDVFFTGGRDAINLAVG